ncbi:T9SS type A sorting domain-containing protein [Hymenobacter ruber]
MKKSLLFLGLLGFAGHANAQTNPWTIVNVPTSNILGQSNVVNLSTLSPTMVWGVTSDKVASTAPASIPRNFIRSNNAAGDQFDWGEISVTSGPTKSSTVGNISGINATTAVACSFPGSTFDGAATYGGEIVKTTNGGQSWTKVTTAAQFAGGFCNWVHMFDATTGVALGDPTNGAFEILRTTDGGTTWNRLTSNVPAPLANEYGNAGAYFALGNTIWVGMASSSQTSQVRVFKSTDKGLTWTASAPTPITYLIDKVAFKDANNGIAFGYNTTAGAISSVTYARTNDGGATWTQITPNNTTSGNFYRNDLDAVNGVYYSTGPRFPVPATNQAPEDFGSSYSTDGVNWTTITLSGTTLNAPGYFFSMDLIPGTTPGTTVGYSGLYTDVNGVGGIYKYAGTITATATRNAALQSALNVYPNPSASGVFNVDLGSELKTGAVLTVSDALGRQVKSQTLNAAAIGSRKINLDLSGEKTGVYTLQIRTDAGLATQKIVID